MKIHFFWSGEKFLLVDLLAIASARTIYPKATVFLWYDLQGEGLAWYEAVRLTETVHYHAIAGMLPRVASCAENLSDVVSYAALHRFGGLYLDIDTICLSPLPPLVDYGFAAARQASGVVSCGVMRGRRGNPVCHDAMEQAGVLCDKPFGATGPRLLTPIADRYGFDEWPAAWCYQYPWTERQRYWEDRSVPPDAKVLHYYGHHGRDAVQDLMPDEPRPTMYHRAVSHVFPHAWSKSAWWRPS